MCIFCLFVFSVCVNVICLLDFLIYNFFCNDYYNYLVIKYFQQLQGLSTVERQKILQDVADALEANEGLIRMESEAYIEVAQVVGIPESLISRLTLKSGKVIPLLSCDYFVCYGIVEMLKNCLLGSSLVSGEI